MSRKFKKNKYSDPNDEVEQWKDRVYQKTKNMTEDQLIQYFQKTIDWFNRQYQIKPLSA